MSHAAPPRAFWLLLAAFVCSAPLSAAEPTIFRSGDEVIVRIENLDQLRQRHPKLVAAVRIAGAAGIQDFTINLADALTPPALVFDLSGFGECRGVSLEVTAGDGKTILSQRAVPVPQVSISPAPQTVTGKRAAIEPGSQFAAVAAPQIRLPDVARLRKVPLGAAARTLTQRQITYPVIADADLPALASQNGVIVSRQSFAPQDKSKCSLYFSYRKGIFDPATASLKGYRKMLVEVPLDRRWLEQQGDQVITLPVDGFAIHTTAEREAFGNRWNAPQGYNILGESSSGLYQGGSTVDIDDEGRIYISNVADGAGIVRFNPRTAKFEQPPLNFHEACRAFLPTGGEWKRSWDAELGQVVCARGQVFIVFDRNYRVNTPNGKFETCSGVVSLPQAHWDDAEEFRKAVRFHAGCWPSAENPLYSDDVTEGQPRRAGAPVETQHGIAFGTWRLELDDQGRSTRLAVVKNLADSQAADGSPIAPTQRILRRGLPKSRVINVGSAGRQFLKFGYGECELSRAALGLTLPDVVAEPLGTADGRYLTTYPGAPAGNLTIRFDIAGKIKAEAERFAELAASLTGPSQGPNYAVIALPGKAEQAIGVCEYSYYFSQLDFSRRAREGKVFRTYLPLSAGGQPTSLPIGVGFGPYNSAWIEHDGAQWLYLMGYTGLGRLKYSARGQPLAAFQQELIHTRLSPNAIDGAPHDQIKDYLQLFPTTDGRLIHIGRGRAGRGGGAYSAGLTLFHPSTLGASSIAAGMNRCSGLSTPVTRLVWSTAGKPPRQEIYVAGGTARPEYLLDIADPAQRPQNTDPKIFAYDCASGGSLRDLFGFALPQVDGRPSPGSLAFSPCRQFLLVLQEDGVLQTFSVAQQRFVDGLQLRNASDQPLRLPEFIRPSGLIWSAPNGQLFFHAALEGDAATEITFYSVQVGTDGRLTVSPHLTVAGDKAGTTRDFERIVKGFLPDLTRSDGSYDLVLGGSQDNGGQPTVRLIEDFVPPGIRP